jgi:hypothetical protein
MWRNIVWHLCVWQTTLSERIFHLPLVQMIDNIIRDKQEKNDGHSKFLPFEVKRAL